MINIIGISGKKQSGKNTIANIIQYITTLELRPHYSWEHFLKYYNSNDSSNLSKWKQKQFAKKLKEIASLLIGISLEDFEKEEVKSKYLPEYKMTVREFLQQLGDKLREINEDIFITSLFADYKPCSIAIGEFNKTWEDGTLIYPQWIITDVRYPNEVEAIKSRGGIIIRVNRPSVVSNDNHKSETSLDFYSGFFDSVIYNDSNIHELIIKVKGILKKFKI